MLSILSSIELYFWPNPNLAIDHSSIVKFCLSLLHILYVKFIFPVILFLHSPIDFLTHGGTWEETIAFNASLTYSLKFSVSILFLIFIRAGVPRYRYDYLTKLGWSKFTVFCIFIFIIEYLIFSLL